MSHPSVLLGLMGLLAVGCAAPRLTPVTLDCRALRMTPVTDPSQRHEFDSSGFSILPPQGEHWCIQQVDSRGILFSKGPLSGKLLQSRPRPAEVFHTFVVIAKAVEISETSVGSLADLLAFVDRWARAGGPVRVLDTRMVLDAAPLARFKLVDFRMAPDTSQGADCVRFEALVEERDNPRMPGSVLVQVSPDNLMCRLPHAASAGLIWIHYSERYVQGEHPGSPTAETLRREVEPVFRSLQFVPSN